MGDDNVEINDNIEEFVWNSTLARINILQLTITDLAFYKNTEDLQKRLAQLHSPGMRPDIFATYNGKRYSDGTFRTVYLKDFDNVKSNVITDLSDIFDELIEKENDPLRKSVLSSKKEFVISEFSKINIADAQGYSSPTSYRKKMGLFGKWGKREEEVYQKILRNEFSADDIDVAFQPLKPFVYGPTTKNGYNDVMPTLKVDMQNKNSEYLLIIADALLRSQGKTNILSSLFDFMEESQGLTKDENGHWIGEPNGKGIDTIQFESTVKTGLTGAIDLSDKSVNKYRAEKNIDESVSNEQVIKAMLSEAAYSESSYNSDYVHEIPFENYAIQQEVPAHFRHEQQQGSQERILIFADIPLLNANGTPNEILVRRYSYDAQMKQFVPNSKSMTVEQAREKYFDNIRKNIEDDIQEITDKLQLDSTNRKKKNILLSRLLCEQIMEDSRFDSDLLWACSTDENGEFNIPLSDPTQADRIQKLLNSIIKNKINKQKVAGGPVVQVSRFGSRDLSIRFRDKNGKILMSENEFNDFIDGNDVPSDRNTNVFKGDTFKEYRKREKHSVAYYECYAPIYDKRLMDFADKDGNIDIQKIENENPKLLEMVGYRIPTESKYSMVPLRIVGFLPRNSGEGIMLPNEITTQSGSDFDIDKLYVMRYMFDYRNGHFVEPRSQKQIRNNENLDITFSVLTSEHVSEQLFTPGNFNTLKKLGYSIQGARRTKEGRYIDKLNEYLESDDIEQIKQDGYEETNMISVTTQIDFHKQNMVASKMIGVFAQANVSHAFCSMGENYINVKDYGFRIIEDGVDHLIQGTVRIDDIYAFNGQKISENLAQLLASSVDAVKDPILNLININMDTVNIVVTLLRLGFSLQTVSVICSQKTLVDTVKEYNIKYADDKNKPSLSRFINKKLYNKPVSNAIPYFNVENKKSSIFTA